MKVCIFCSANRNIAQEYFEMTEELGKYLAENGHELVFGGNDDGLMACIARAVKENGGRITGVVPMGVDDIVTPCPILDTRIDTANLSERKQTMMDISDIFVALPGGVGTLDEIFSVVSSHTIGYHKKLTILYNMGGFWDSLMATLEDMRQRGMLRGEMSEYIVAVSNLEELGKYIK